MGINKKIIIAAILLVVEIVVIVCAGVFVTNHSFSYKYNDSEILGKSPQEIVDKYGLFDMSMAETSDNTKISWAAYYLGCPGSEDLVWIYYIISFQNDKAYIVESERTGIYPSLAQEQNDFPQWTKSAETE